MNFSYRLMGLGCAKATLSHGGKTITMECSYMTDSLRDLLKTLENLLIRDGETRCSWDDEPGEYRWLFNRSESSASLRILYFSDINSQSPDFEGDVLIEFTSSLRDLALSILNGIQEVLNEYGEDGYLELWHEYPFPTEDLRTVQKLLALA